MSVSIELCDIINFWLLIDVCFLLLHVSFILDCLMYFFFIILYYVYDLIIKYISLYSNRIIKLLSLLAFFVPLFLSSSWGTCAHTLLFKAKVTCMHLPIQRRPTLTALTYDIRQ